jgi:glycosyltransferase involved in cell wall biosynthesis
MACNLPVISFDCPSGPSEIIRDGVDGLLVPPADVSALGNAMRRLIDNAPLRSELAQRAGEVVQRFSRKAVMGQWEELIRRVIQSSGKCVSGFKAEDNFKSRVEEPE